MNNYRNITIANYNYTLPEDRIAKYPLESRDESKMLFYNGKQIQTYPFKQISDLLQSNDLLIFNNAKVIQARMDFIKETGAHIEIFCLEPFLPGDYSLAFQAIGHCQWKCLIGNRKKWKKGKLLKKIYINNLEYCIEADLINSISNTEIVEFNWYVSVKQNDSASLSFGEILEYTGNTPLPPYLNREAEELDKSRYQTIYATQKGSVAAPTAGLHFTDEIFKSFSDKGIETDQITLHVSAGTFRPVKSESVENHEMHEEHFEVNQKTIEKLVLHKGRIISVGTTSARTLESLYRIGVKLIKNLDNPFYISQWEVYDNPSDITLYNSFSAILDYMIKNNCSHIKASTRIMIIPGFDFKVIKGLVTNFHQPQSTLLLLIAAAVGERWKEIYNYALRNDYRFLSYGDCSLILI